MARRVQFLPDGSGAGSRELLPWVIAVMVFLSGLALAGALGMHGAVASWAGDMSRRLTVEIVTGDLEARDRQATAAVTALRETPGVESAHRLSDQDIAGLLEPWLGKGNVAADLPVPALIDVVVREGVNLPLDVVANRLRTIAPDARFDDHEQWLGNLYHLAWMLEVSGFGIVLLVMLATVAIVIFGTRAGLASHRDSIETLHLLGAEDSLVAGEFQRRFLYLGFKGGVIGVVAAGLALLSVHHMLSRLGGGIFGSISYASPSFLALLGLPVLAAILAMVTARLTVVRALRQLV
ncbi:cell division protein FtsX [Govanella unica]|uniref:Cell division protein n=1 Tax=Govanella unica TaxID=2975056 RepID=A0A9X3Z616_9PROT|nr:hypothetical protein [Govania unica]MDA5192602.1 cell division protein [Govania unica]